ncbi:MAG TPA: OmpA family protein [Methylophilaceae bacterium]|nr:OmpA family protein [Methylophilaceae bacterium]
MSNNKHPMRRRALAVAISLLMNGVHAEPMLSSNELATRPTPDFAEEKGKRVDNARVETRGIPPSSERQGVSYPLPSGITSSALEAMKAAAANTPEAEPEVRVELIEDNGAAQFESGKAELTRESRAELDALAQQLAGKPGIRIDIAGHTDNQRLSPNARAIFKDNQGLSEARALAVAAYLKDKLGVPESQISLKGYGDSQPVASNNTPQGMAQNRRVQIRVWFNQITEIPVARVVSPLPKGECEAMAKAKAELPFRISVDGEPVDLDDAPLEADRQRCTDVGLEKADIQVRYDNLSILPQMNVWVTPNGVQRGKEVEFRAWANYLPWIRKAEIRLFRPGQQVQEKPMAILPVNWNGATTWQVPASQDDQVMFLLRVYDDQGRYDESALKPLLLLSNPPTNTDLQPGKEELIGYGENSLSLRNIPVKGGTVTVNGSHLKSGQQIEAFGLRIPVDNNGRFAMKQIMPSGPNTVEVKLIEPDGESSTFRRNLTIAEDDWFYVAMGDLTIGNNSVDGPAQLVTGDKQHYDNSTYVDGRGAFYLKGKIKGEYLLTASADTREQPLEHLFTNFSSKDPRYLLRNINPDLYYPVYGDDSTTVDDAPTQGKFYVKLERGESHVMWGNFRTTWNGTELLQYSRGLYGANARYRSEATTTHGEKRTQVDAFAADPGTLNSRDEFRGTGGSLYYLRHQDITMGSERVWVEVRDRDSGLVIERKLLAPAQDYEINYLQGRITLNQPLNSTGAAPSMISTSSLNGNALYLVTTYEYVPGFMAVDNISIGGRASQWVNDHWQIGVSGYKQGEGLTEQKLGGINTTIRYKPGTYIKFEAARSEGAGEGTSTSLDGGFAFNGLTPPDGDANAYRVEAAVDLAEVTEDGEGKITAYAQERQSGFSGPGQITYNGEALSQQGVKASVEITDTTKLEAKGDAQSSDSLDVVAVEVGVREKLNPEWELGVAVRQDGRNVHVTNASDILSQTGDRTDSQVRLDYTPLKEDGETPGEPESWAAYGYVQGTLARDEERDPNNRAGLGMSWQVTDRIKLVAEGSHGNLGPGVKLGADYRLSDRSNAYTNYLIETERSDSLYRGRHGTFVNGSSYRVSDEMRVFGETRRTDGSGPQSLIHAFGLDFAATDYWTIGGKGEVGELSDPLAGDLKRRAVSVSLAYKRDETKYSGNVELRDEDSNVAGERKTWLVRNTFGYQATPEWRLLGKANFSISNNSQGAFYDGDFHELVLGAAFRPIANDKWNTLFKYTNFYNLPSPGQLAPSGLVADYAQRSQVLSVDTIYDLKPWLSIGGKYAMRIGELKDNKVGGEWFNSKADLIILRADWHFVKEWDALFEIRNLRATEAEDAKAGALVAIYRHMGNHVKAGVGYNFTDYSDDLTDLDYRSRGWFINVLGTM